MADVNRPAEGVTAPKATDVAALEAFEGTDVEIVATFIREVTRMRDQDLPDVVILRSGDLEVLLGVRATVHRTARRDPSRVIDE